MILDSLESYYLEDPKYAKIQALNLKEV